MLTRKVLSASLSGLVLAACGVAPAAAGGLSLDVSITTQRLDGSPAPIDSTHFVPTHDSVRFMVVAEFSGGAMPAFGEFTADLMPDTVCEDAGVIVSDFEFGDWAQVVEDPTLSGGDIIGGGAVQLPLFGPVDHSSPLVVATFEATFTKPGYFLFRAASNMKDGMSFGVLADTTNIFAFPVRFDASVANSIRIFACGSGCAVPCNEADIAEPFGLLDLSDIQSFISAFTHNSCRGDFSTPWGVFDLADIQRYIASFVDGCP